MNAGPTMHDTGCNDRCADGVHWLAEQDATAEEPSILHRIVVRFAAYDRLWYTTRGDDRRQFRRWLCGLRTAQAVAVDLGRSITGARSTYRIWREPMPAELVEQLGDRANK